MTGDRVVAVLDEAVAAGVTPGYSAYVVRGGAAVFSVAGGRRRVLPAPAAAPASTQTRYDLASITKLYTTAAALRLVAARRLDLDAPLPGRDYGARHLLAHTSGLPAWRPLHEAPDPLAAALATPPEAPPGTRQVYSDIGFMVLSHHVTAIAGIPFDVFVTAEVLRPLRLVETAWRPREPPPVAATFEARPPGEVDDDNCRALGGVAGHAGLYATAGDVARFGLAWLRALRGEDPWLPASLVARAFHERPALPGATYALGFDSPAPGGASTAGRHVSARAVGHLGYAGTSVWIDPDRDAVIVLLTNRIHPRRDGPGKEGIRALRVAFHDAVYEELV